MIDSAPEPFSGNDRFSINLTPTSDEWGPGSNVGHIFVNLTAESRPFPAVDIA